MKALILNSGIGKRLNQPTSKIPKCLTKINGKTILGHEIENILHYGIKDFIITVGPFEEKIKKFMKDNFPQVDVTYIKNLKYKTTNAIYSMWLVKDFIDDDIVYMHGDMVFEKELLGKLLNSKYENCVLINNKIKPPEKDFKGEIKNNFVTKIGVDIFGKNAAFLAPIYKYSKNSLKLWLKEIEKLINRGEVNVYAENAFNNISDQIKLNPVYYENEFCMEIDNFDDLEIARKFFKNNKI